MENTSSSSSTTEPQIFINAVAESVTSLDIENACQAACGAKPSTLTLRASQNNKLQNCLLTFASNEHVDSLLSKGELLLSNGVSLKLVKSQTIFPNLFLKNEQSGLTEVELNEFMASTLTGSYQIYYGNGQVSFFIQNEAELRGLINSQRIIKGKTCLFEKYTPSTVNKAKNQLFLRIYCNINEVAHQETLKTQIETTYGLLSAFSQRDYKVDSIVVSLSFKKEQDALKLFQAVGSNNHQLLHYKSINVSWARQEDSGDSDNQKIFLKFLRVDVTEDLIREALNTVGKVVYVDISVSNKMGQCIQSAHVKMSTADECTEVMIKAHKSQKIKSLFLERPSISPFVSKQEMEAIKQVKYNSNIVHAPFNQAVGQFGIPNMQYPPMQANSMIFNSHYGKFAPNQANHNQKPHRQNQSQHNQKPGKHQNQQQTKNHNNKKKQQHLPNTIPSSGQNYQDQFPSALPLSLKNQQQQMLDLIKNDPKAFNSIVMKELEDRTRQDLLVNHPTQIKELPIIIDTLTNPEVLSQEEVIELIFNKEQRLERIAEALELIISEKLEASTAV